MKLNHEFSITQNIIATHIDTRTRTFTTAELDTLEASSGTQELKQSS